ncbi:hypothetical protein C6946_31175, partial [Burkholderia thailandensis]
RRLRAARRDVRAGAVADLAVPVGPARPMKPARLARPPQPVVRVRRFPCESEGGWRPAAFACTIAAR